MRSERVNIEEALTGVVRRQREVSRRARILRGIDDLQIMMQRCSDNLAALHVALDNAINAWKQTDSTAAQSFHIFCKAANILTRSPVRFFDILSWIQDTMPVPVRRAALALHEGYHEYFSLDYQFEHEHLRLDNRQCSDAMRHAHEVSHNHWTAHWGFRWGYQTTSMSDGASGVDAMHSESHTEGYSNQKAPLLSE